MISPKQAVRRLATASIFYLASTDTCMYYASASSTTTASGEQSAGKLRSLGEAAMSERRFEEAASYYAKAIEVEPKNSVNYFKLFRVHSRMRSYVAALKDITQACDNEMGNTEYRFQKAKLLINVGQCDEAVEQFTIMQQYGMDGLNLEDVRKTMHEAEQCSKLVNAATQAHASGNWEEAVQYFERAMSYIEQNYDYLFMKAQAEFSMGDFYGTVSDTGKILKAYSKHIEAYELRGQAYFRLGEHDTAVQHYREGLKLDPEHKGCKAAHKIIKNIMKKNNRGEDALMAGKHQEAIEHFWSAIKADLSHKAFVRPTILKIVKAHSALGQHEEAVQQAQKHVDEETTLEGLFALGDAQLDAEMYQEAVNTFRQSVEFEPNDKQQECNRKLQNAETALKQSKEKNYYKILGISRTADKKAIKKAYRDLALKWHPDKAEDKEKAEKMFQDISEANEVLSDEELRAKYDRGEPVFENQGGGGGGGRHHGFPEQMFRNHFNHGGGGNHRTHFRFHNN